MSISTILDQQNSQERSRPSRPVVRKISLSTPCYQNKCSAFLRWISGDPGHWTWTDIPVAGFQDVNELKVMFHPSSIGISYKGNIITNVVKESQADLIGVCRGWKILAINGENLSNNSETIKKCIDMTNKQGQMTEILFLKSEKNVKKILFQSKTKGFAYVGNCITGVDTFSQAFYAGVKKGWIIVGVNDESMPNDSLVIQKAIEASSNRSNVTEITFEIPVEDSSKTKLTDDIVVNALETKTILKPTQSDQQFRYSCYDKKYMSIMKHLYSDKCIVK